MTRRGFFNVLDDFDYGEALIFLREVFAKHRRFVLNVEFEEAEEVSENADTVCEKKRRRRKSAKKTVGYYTHTQKEGEQKHARS